jgi:enoyl-[acyl-carrier protein] reductase/trans-2-enoyl-CoA reductase (NAD+)
MIIKPKVRGFVCVTAHPHGLRRTRPGVQINHVKAKGPIKAGPKRVLVIGASTGYGLASRITAAFGSGAATARYFLRAPLRGRPPRHARLV